jgi:hypothetical protein
MRSKSRPCIRWFVKWKLRRWSLAAAKIRCMVSFQHPSGRVSRPSPSSENGSSQRSSPRSWVSVLGNRGSSGSFRQLKSVGSETPTPLHRRPFLRNLAFVPSSRPSSLPLFSALSRGCMQEPGRTLPMPAELPLTASLRCWIRRTLRPPRVIPCWSI